MGSPASLAQAIGNEKALMTDIRAFEFHEFELFRQFGG